MFKNVLLRIGDYVFVLRPLILIPVWSFFLLGAAAGSKRSFFADAGWTIPNGMLCLTAIMITAYLLNQVFDQDSDRRNDKCHHLTRGIFSARSVVLMAMIFFLAGAYFFRSAESSQRLPLILALVLALTYSLPPLRLVARPFADLAANAVGYGGLAYVIGYGALTPAAAGAIQMAAPYVLLVGATFLYTTILDAEGDRDSGKNTTTVYIGVKRSADLACLLCGAGTIWAFAVSLTRFSDWLPAVLLTAALAVFVAGAVRLRKCDREGGERARIASNVVQASTAFVTVAAVLVWPAYLALVIPLVVVSRFYYRARFSLDYPGPAKNV